MFGRIRTLLGLGREAEEAADGTAGDDESAGDGGSIWDFIPGRQYGGRHAESGGIARGEQERAIREVERTAKIVEGDGDHADPALDREER